jgi:hypothetical protein
MKNVVAIGVGLAMLLSGCSSADASGLVRSAQNEAQQGRLNTYKSYADLYGRNAAWSDQVTCTVRAASGLTSRVAELAYPEAASWSALTFDENVDTATDIGDEALVEALQVADEQAHLLIDNHDMTLRDALNATISTCNTSELEEVRIADLIEAVLAEPGDFVAWAHQFGGPVWASKDGTWEWRESGISAPEPESAKGSEADPSPVIDDSNEAAMDLEATFNAMIIAIAADGEAGLTPFLADPEAGDLWGISDWTWAPGECFEGAPGESGCVGTFVKNGTAIENVFLFDQVDGVWLLTDSWADGEGGS